MHSSRNEERNLVQEEIFQTTNFKMFDTFLPFVTSFFTASEMKLDYFLQTLNLSVPS